MIILGSFDVNTAFIGLLIFNCFGILFGKVSTGQSLANHHLVEFAILIRLEILSESLFSQLPVRQDVDEIVTHDLREIVGDDDGSLLLAPMSDCLEDE
jgi:uncharacterized membrane protein YuzA (DUF378 family)